MLYHPSFSVLNLMQPECISNAAEVARNTHTVDRACLKPLTPELNPSAQRYVTRFFTIDFTS
jgi:hypothetical protein